jgi:dipeptidyl aminopeptidase/acylaminoacyl peptidase
MLLEGIAAAGAVLGARALAHQLILRGLRAPRVPHALHPVDRPVPAGCVHEVAIPGPRGRTLFAWLVMPPTAGAPVPAVLAMHGWGGNAAMMWPVVPPLHAAGFAVLLIDARCHGRSDDDGFTSMPRFAEDIAAGLAWLRRQPGIAAARLALLGHSVGAAAALLHAARHADVRAVVSLSSFAHPDEVMRRLLAAKRVPYPLIGWYVLRHVQRVIGTRFDAIAPLHTITRVRCPVLLVHGVHDDTVPFEDARRLQAACGTARLLSVEGGHDLRVALVPHGDRVVGFLREAMRPPAAAACAAWRVPASSIP